MTQKDPTLHKRRAQRPAKKAAPSKAPARPDSADSEKRTASQELDQGTEWFEDDMVPGEDIAGMQRPPDDS